MGDSGLSLGAVQLYWNNHKKEILAKTIKECIFRPIFLKDEILKAFKRFSEKIIWNNVSNVEFEIAKLIHKGFIVGRFAGKSEWGPRALGNRSILIRPTDKSINDVVNKRLNRSEFMPFAPSVLDYRANDYFQNYDKNLLATKFMTITYNVL